MNFEYTPKVNMLRDEVTRFMDKHIYPLEQEYEKWVHHPETMWQVFPKMEELKSAAREEGLWNLFLPEDYGAFSPGLSNLEYAPLAEIMGRVPWSSEVFNCSAPDTGNMEVLAKYGTAAQQEQWLTKLMAGEIRSAFLMTEPLVASSDDGYTFGGTEQTSTNRRRVFYPVDFMVYRFLLRRWRLFRRGSPIPGTFGGSGCGAIFSGISL